MKYDFAMAISDDDKLSYVKFAVQVAMELNVVSIDPSAILWHYTTGSTLISIFESMSVYSTQLSCLNDSTELRYASKHFQNALRATRAEITSTGLAADLLDGALEYFKEDPDAPFQAGVFHFVTCFSADRDDWPMAWIWNRRKRVRNRLQGERPCGRARCDCDPR